MKSALLIIDVQNDYLPNGNMELVNSVQAVDNITHLIKLFREEKKDIIYIKHLNVRPGATFFVPNTSGCEIVEQIKPNHEDAIVEKNYPNSFRNTKLSEVLKSKQIEKLVICGMMTQMCVDATTRAANDLDYTITLVQDACATRDLVLFGETIKAEYVQKSFIAALNGLYAEVVNTNDFKF